jgi:hypothetical protein
VTVDTAPSPSVRNKRVMEALILALGSSEISKIVNVGTLRYFIEFTFRDMFSGTSFDLQPLWNTLAAEPGLTPEMIYPPLLQFREWQGRLGITVTLPKPMQTLGRADIDQHLARIQVKATDVERLFQEAVPARSQEGSSGRFVPSAAAPRSAVPQRVAPRLSERYLHAGASATQPHEGEGEEEDQFAHASKSNEASFLARHRSQVTAICGLVVVATFVFVGVRLFGHHGSSTSLDRARAILKLERARRVDYVVTAVIADPRWNGMAADERRKTVDAIFRTLEPEGVKTLILRGPTGQSRAMISTVGGRRTINVY